MKKLKKILSIILSLLLVITSIITVLPVSYAESNTDSTTLDNEFEVDEEYDYSYDDLRDLVPGEDYVENEIIVCYKEQNNNTSSIPEMFDDYGLTLDYCLSDTTDNVLDSEDTSTYLMTMSDMSTNIVNIIKTLEDNPDVVYAQPNYIYTTCEEAQGSVDIVNKDNSKDYDNSQLSMFQSLSSNKTDAWWSSTGGSGITIAVIDSGIDLDHPALTGCLWNENGVYGYNTTDPDNITEITMSNCDDYADDHGTHVAGIIGMQSSSTGEYTCKGIAPGAKIIDLQATNNPRGYETVSIIAAIEKAVDLGADVVNLSLGGDQYDYALNLACNRAARSSVIVASAGNKGLSTSVLKNYPAAFSSVIGVMAYGGSPMLINDSPNSSNYIAQNYPSTGSQTLYSSSNYDFDLVFYDIVAPGVNVCSAKIGGIGNVSGYFFNTGTSMASPIVAASVALYLAKYPSATPGQVRAALRSSTGRETVSGKNNPIYNKLDIENLLDIHPNPNVSRSYSKADVDGYEKLCELIKINLGYKASEEITITNDDLTLISYLTLDSFESIGDSLDKLDELSRLVSLTISGYDFNNTRIRTLLNENQFAHLEKLEIFDTGVYQIDLNNQFSEALSEINFHDNVNLSYLTNLDSVNIRTLQLENNNISDLTFLTESNKLFASLYLSGNKIKDLTPLTDLTGVVHLYLSDNCIDDYTPIFDINYLNDVDLSDNYLSDSEDEIESLLNSDSDHPIFVYKPFKDDFVEIENIKLNDFSIKRTDVDYIPKPIISPANATFANNTNLSVSENDIVTVNRYTGQINYNPEYQFDSTNTVFNTNINYSNNGISGTAQLNLLMPVIEELNYEKYIYDTGTTQNYITMSTTTDTTAVKVVQTNTESGAIIGTPIEKNIINDCDYTDYGDNRIVTFSYNENISPDSTVTVYAGDSLGYFSSETINNTNTIEISIEGTNISNISGSSKFLNIINDFNTTGIESNAIGMLCDIENIYFSENIYILAENAFNGSNVKNAIFYSLEPFETEEGVFGTCNDNLTVYPCYDEPSLTYECEQAGITCITNFEFDGHTLTKYYGNSSSVTIPECLKITTIGPNAFKSNYYLKTIDLGEAIYAINDSAFFDCKKLQNVINSENIKRIGNNAFSKSTITDIDISGAEVISSSAFLNCKNITNIVLLGNTETNTFILNDSAFKNCTELKTISYKGTLELGSEVFMGCSKLTDVFSEDVKLTEGTSGGAAFSGCTALTTITLSEDSNIPDESFDGCISLTNVKVKNTETLTIGENAFRGTAALSELGLLAKEIYFETNSLGNEATDLIIYCNADAIKSLSPSVGSVCTDFKTVIWNNKVILEDYLGNSENVVIPDCLEIYQIGSKVFYLKDFLKTIDLPKTLEIIGKQAFSMSFNLEVVSGGEHVKYLGESAFYNDKKLFDIQSLQSLQYLEYASLAYTNISNYRMPQTVYYCNQMVFLGCSALKEIVLSGNLYAIPSGMFYNCSSLERCIIKYGTQLYGQQIFDGCNNLTHIYIPDSANLIQGNSFVDTIVLYSSPNLQIDKDDISNTIYPNYFVVDGTLLAYNSETGYDYLDTATGERIIKIPNAVERIAPGVFEGKQNIDKIIFYDNYLKAIDNYAFKNCSVYEVVLPTSITCIGVGAFEGTNLISIDIPDSISKIESYCFDNTPLSSVTIPRSVTEIANNAFSNCEQLESLFIHDDVTTIGNNAFENCTNLTIKAYVNSTPLTYAQDHYIPYENIYRLNPLEGSSTVFNRNAGYIYGLKTSLIKTYFQNRCTQLDEGYTLAYEMTHVRYMGTDTVVKVMKGDTVVETYKILIFGDLSGDGQINHIDVSIISDIIDGTYELEEGSLVEIAADVYQPGSGITIEDKELLHDVYWDFSSLPQNPYATI